MILCRATSSMHCAVYTLITEYNYYRRSLISFGAWILYFIYKSGEFIHELNVVIFFFDHPVSPAIRKVRGRRRIFRISRERERENWEFRAEKWSEKCVSRSERTASIHLNLSPITPLICRFIKSRSSLFSF